MENKLHEFRDRKSAGNTNVDFLRKQFVYYIIDVAMLSNMDAS